MTPVRVVVVDDSAICRELLRDILQHDGDIVVVGEASNGVRAVELVQARAPDIVTMDVQMPGMGGIEAIGRIMAESPRPILVVTGQPLIGSVIGFEAVQAGALDVTEKPTLGDPVAERALRERIRELACVPVVRRAARPQHLMVPTATTTTNTAATATTATTRLTTLAVPRLIGVVASAGGPAALVQVLSALPATFPLPIAVVQHLPIGFAASFAQFLRGRVALPVVSVSTTTILRPGTIYLPVDDTHLVALERHAIGSATTSPVDGHRPAGNELLRTMAEHCGSAAVGVVLTGLGRDGANGLAALRHAGGLTIAQDEASSAVWGMPRAAIEQGAASAVLPLEEIGPALMGVARMAR